MIRILQSLLRKQACRWYETFGIPWHRAMYTKIKQGGTTYDIAIPSEYDCQNDEGKLGGEINHSQIGLENIVCISFDQPFDPGNQYSGLISGEPGHCLYTKWLSTRLNTGTTGSQNTEPIKMIDGAS